METRYMEILTDVFLTYFSFGMTEPEVCELRTKVFSHVKILLKCVFMCSLVCIHVHEHTIE